MSKHPAFPWVLGAVIGVFLFAVGIPFMMWLIEWAWHLWRVTLPWPAPGGAL